MPRFSPCVLALSISALLSTFGGLATTATADTGMSTDQALELAKKTGRPIFAVAGSET